MPGKAHTPMVTELNIPLLAGRTFGEGEGAAGETQATEMVRTCSPKQRVHEKGEQECRHPWTASAPCDMGRKLGASRQRLHMGAQPRGPMAGQQRDLHAQRLVPVGTCSGSTRASVATVQHLLMYANNPPPRSVALPIGANIRGVVKQTMTMMRTCWSERCLNSIRTTLATSCTHRPRSGRKYKSEPKLSFCRCVLLYLLLQVSKNDKPVLTRVLHSLSVASTSSVE
jgi:hypothetical protein